jgi:hypothetical protein
MASSAAANPKEMSFIAADAVNCFVTDAAMYFVSSVTGISRAASLTPADMEYTKSPRDKTSDTPGTRVEYSFNISRER